MLSRLLLRSHSSRTNLLDRPITHCEALESRRLLAQTSTFTQTDGDIYTLNLTGPGSYTVTAAPDGDNITLIALAGTTLASNFSLILTTDVDVDNDNPDLRLQRLTGGTLNSLTLDAVNVDVRPIANPVLRGSSGPGIFLTGYARTVNIGDLFEAELRLESTSGQNRSAITVEDLNDLQDSLNNGGDIFSGGVIDSLNAQRADRGSVTAQRIGSIVVDNTDQRSGDFNELGSGGGGGSGGFDRRFDITTTSTTASFGVKTIVFNRRIEEGTWSIAAPVQSIVIEDVAILVPNFTRGDPNAPGPFVLDVTGRVSSLTSLEDLSGTITARSFGSIKAANDIIASITTNGPASNSATSIDSLRASRLFNSEITVTNGIGLFNVSRVELSNVSAGWVDFFNVIGSPSDTQSVVSSDILLINTARTSVLKSMVVQGSTNSSNFRFLNNIGNVTLDSLGSSTLFLVGLPLNQTTAPANAAAFTTNGTVAKFTLRAPVGGGTNFGTAAILAARTFTNLTVDLRPTGFANGGTVFGVFADTITSLNGNFRLTATTGFNNNTFTTPSEQLIDNDFRLRIL